MILDIMLLMIALVIGLGAYASKKIMYPKTRDYDRVWSFEKERNPLIESFANQAPFEEIEFTTEDQLIHKGWWLPHDNPQGVIVVVHGIRMNKYASLKYMEMFWQMGYTVMTFDLRNHGDSITRDTFTSYGYYERLDVVAAIDYATEKTSGKLPILTHGESMGATTVLMHAGIDSRIKGVIADCGFDSAYRVFKEISWRENHLPAWPMLPIASFINWMKTGAWYQQMSPLMDMDHIKCPILLFHGTSDDYIIPDHARILKSELEKHHVDVSLVMIENAGHAKAIIEDPIGYRKKCQEFLKRV